MGKIDATIGRALRASLHDLGRCICEDSLDKLETTLAVPRQGGYNAGKMCEHGKFEDTC
jgi:hypothetical protein